MPIGLIRLIVPTLPSIASLRAALPYATANAQGEENQDNDPPDNDPNYDFLGYLDLIVKVYGVLRARGKLQRQISYRS